VKRFTRSASCCDEEPVFAFATGYARRGHLSELREFLRPPVNRKHRSLVFRRRARTCNFAREQSVEQRMNIKEAKNQVQWLFLDLNAFFASCEQQETPGLRGKPVIVVQTLTDSAVAIAASYEAKAFGIKTGTLVREARRLCPQVIPVEANHRRYTEYYERILAAVDTCLPVEKVMSIDEMACRLMGTERHVMVAREVALKIKRALREQAGECLTCSIGIAPNIFLGKVGSDLQKPDGLVVITKDDLPGILLGLELQDIYGIGERMERRLHRAGIYTVAELWEATPFRLRRIWGGINGLLFHQMLHGVDIQPPSSRFAKSMGHQHVLEPDLRTKEGAANFARHLLTKAAEHLRRGDYYYRRLGLHLSWVGDLGGWWARSASPRRATPAFCSAVSTSCGSGCRLTSRSPSGSCCSISFPLASTSRIYSTPQTSGGGSCHR
jgi:nucleotidyltransferase/DNA polymerase involved in DNA repair